MCVYCDQPAHSSQSPSLGWLWNAPTIQNTNKEFSINEKPYSVIDVHVIIIIL